LSKLFRLQECIPGAVEAEAGLVETILTDGSLKRSEKQALLSALAFAQQSAYCQRVWGQGTPEAPDDRLLRFCLKLALHAPWCSRGNVDALLSLGFGEAAVLEAVATAALSRLLCTLAAGLRPDVDPGMVAPEPPELPAVADGLDFIETPGPYLSAPPALSAEFGPYRFFREQFGFVPNVYRAQAGRPDLIEAEAQLLDAVLIPEERLSRAQKEEILLANSAANLNTYFVAVQTQILAALGVAQEECELIVADHRTAGLSDGDKGLLDVAVALANPQAGEIPAPRLAGHGFTEPQVVEAIVMSALANFLTTMQAGLGAVPDFPPTRVFSPKDLHPFAGESRPTFDAAALDDPDASLVSRVQNGETDAFELLVRKHTRRVVGTLAGIVGNLDDAKDAAQDVFLKAYENIGRFEGKSKFSTWLMSIAINTGTEVLRRRRPSEPLEEFDEEEGFRPRQIRSWAENPEQQVAASQVRNLVQQGILRLPEKYRVAVLLRDINQLSTEEAATALGLSVPAMKARVLRGRLMLRESLAPHFMLSEKGALHD
jgi:RNA polymerase sigma-70 factor (ECF subfamily)